MAQISSFPSTVRIVFGYGSVEEIGALAQELGMSRACIVTDKGLVKAGITARVLDALGKADIEGVVYDSVEPNPNEEAVRRAVALYRDAGCTGVIAVGGGSSMDVAKVVGMLVANQGNLFEYVARDKVLKPSPPLIAVPTTVGTGSEMTPVAVITDDAQCKKIAIVHNEISARVAILDPDMTLTLPSSQVVSTGLDALTHAVETIMSASATPFTDALATESLRLIAHNLPIAAKSEAKESRANLLYASAMAGMAFRSAGLALAHAMSHPVTCYHNVPHGLATAILLPPVLAFNAPVCGDRLARIAAAMGEASTPEAAIEAVRALNAQLGVPTRLSATGVTGEFIPQMAEDALEARMAAVTNPRKPSLQDIIDLYEETL